MRLTDEAFEDFKVLWQQEYPGEDRTDEELRDIATRVLRAFEIIYRPIPADKAEEFAKYATHPPDDDIS